MCCGALRTKTQKATPRRGKSGSGMSRGDHRAAERRVLSLLHGRAAPARLREIHGHVLRCGLAGSNLVVAHLVSVAAALCRVPYALALFRHHPAPALPLFNAAIKAISLSPSFAPDALRLFAKLKARGLAPDRLTFAPLLKACSHLSGSHSSLGQSVHAQVLVSGFDSHVPVSIGTVEFYASCGQMSEASKVFDGMAQRDVVVWNLMINGYCRRGDWVSGFHLFRQMEERSVVTWNSMIAGLADSGRDGEALELFREMWDCSRLEPDDATLVTVLPVCSRLGNLAIGRWIHCYADRKGLSKNATNVGNSIIDMYCKCGDLQSAWLVFDEMPQRSVVSWNAMINGMALFHGHSQMGLRLFEEMTESGIKPTAGTFVGVLGCCTHAGLVDRGRELFASMAAKHGIEPKLEHYGCMVDLLGRCGFVEEAYEWIKRMPIRPSAAIWGALLSACRSHGKLDTAELATKALIELEPWNSGNYVLLANIYAERGRWEEVENVRRLMRGKRIHKVAGKSLIEQMGTEQGILSSG